MPMGSTFFDQGPWGAWAGQAWAQEEQRKQQESQARVAEAEATIAKIASDIEAQSVETELLKRFGAQEKIAEINLKNQQARYQGEAADDVDANREDVRKGIYLDEKQLSHTITQDEIENSRANKKVILDGITTALDIKRLEIEKQQATNALRRVQVEEELLPAQRRQAESQADYNDALANEAAERAEADRISNEYARVNGGRTPKDDITAINHMKLPNHTQGNIDKLILNTIVSHDMFKDHKGQPMKFGGTIIQQANPAKGEDEITTDLRGFMVEVNGVLAEMNLDENKMQFQGMSPTQIFEQALSIARDRTLIRDPAGGQMFYVGPDPVTGDYPFLDSRLAHYRDIIEYGTPEERSAILDGMLEEAALRGELPQLARKFPMVKYYNTNFDYNRGMF